MSTICCPPDYSILFPLIINVSVPNSSIPRNPLCFSGITAMLGVIPIKKKVLFISILSFSDDCSINYIQSQRLQTQFTGQSLLEYYIEI